LLEKNKIYNEDCIGDKGMCFIDDNSIDMILCDLPYGTTACKWDSIIPFEPLWKQYERIIKPNGAIVLTASQPFASFLIMSNPNLFKYDIIWHKERPTDPLNAKKRIMRYHESILIFYKKQPTYNPILTKKRSKK
jgi:site-specific DNA-methyltransferase (adenine-specific)